MIRSAFERCRLRRKAVNPPPPHRAKPILPLRKLVAVGSPRAPQIPRSRPASALTCRIVVRVWALAGLAGVAAGCLSGGPPPTGQRLTTERGPVRLQFLGPKPGAPLLVWEHVDNFETGSELHVLTPSITAPEGVTVASSDPPQVVLVLRK